MNAKIIDCTLRDGGLVNNFYFDNDFVKHLYETNKSAGIDYMEFGYKTSKSLFSTNDYGKWKFCDEEDIRSIVGNNDSPMKISVMVDVGRCDYRKDILPKDKSVIDMIRIATYADTIPDAIQMIEYCHNLGYETTINLMAASTLNINKLIQSLHALKNSAADIIYLVDSYGALYPHQVNEYIQLYLAHSASQQQIGIHAHNNQQLAFANTFEAYRSGAQYLDVTINSLGRGAGNCSSELLLNAITDPHYQISPILQFIENYILPLKNQGLKWGYDLPYLLTGSYNLHPSSAIQFINEGKTQYSSFNEQIKPLQNCINTSITQDYQN